MNAGTTLGSFVGGTGIGQIPSQTLAATTETEFVQNYTANSAGTVLTTGIAVISVPTGSEILGRTQSVDPSASAAKLVSQQGRVFQQQVHSNWNSGNVFANGRPFRLRLCGVATPASNGANTLALNIYYGSTKGGTLIATTGANTGTETSTQAGAFILEAELIWDSVGQILGGQQWYSVVAGGTPLYNTWKALTANPTAVTAALLKFCASAQWGNSAGGTIAISSFSLISD